MVLGSDGTPDLITQIEQASVVVGPFSQLYQVTSAGLSSLQGQLSSGAYQLLSSALKPGQVFVNKGWLLVAVEKALKSLDDQSSFVTALQRVIGSPASQYVATITQAALVHGAIATHTVQAVFNVIDQSQSQPIPVFTVSFAETDLQQNFHLFIGPNNTQTVQFDFQLIRSGTKATLVSSNSDGIDNTDFSDIWDFTLQPVYVEEMQKMGHTGVPLPFMAGFQFLFDQATVALQPGYVDVVTDVKYIGTPAVIEALAREPGTVDLFSLLRQGAVAADATRPTREPARWAGSSRSAGLSRTRTTAAKTRLV